MSFKIQIANQKIIGFDIRKPGQLGIGADKWSNQKAQFRPTNYINRAWVTFDKYVNPSCFLHEDRLTPAEQRSRQDEIVVSRGNNVGFNLFYLWDNVMDMMSFYPGLEESNDAAFAYAWIDLSDFGIARPNDDGFGVLTSMETNPKDVGADWPLLGIDFASMYFISALAGYDHSYSSPKFIEYMRPRINSLGLVNANVSEQQIADILNMINVEIGEDEFFAVAIYALFDHSGRLLE